MKTKYSLTGESTDKLGYIYIIEYYSSIKRSKKYW